MRRRRRWAGRILLGLALVVACGIPRAARGADDELVKLLVSQGTSALEKNRFDEAAQKFRRAVDEDAKAIEGWWGLGQALEKKNDKPGAIDAYRSASDAMAARRKDGIARPEDGATAAKASGRLEALVPGEAELRRLQDAYVADLLALARERADADPAAAKRAVDALLLVSPDDAAAQALAKRLGIAGTADAPASGAKPSVKGFSKWDDLIGRQALSGDTLSYDGTVLTHEAKEGGEIAWAEPQPETGDRFVLELEMRVAKQYGSAWHGGWAFYEKDGRFLALRIQARSCTLVQHTNDEFKDLAEADLPAGKDSGAWRRLALTVSSKRRLAATVDGKAVFTHDLPEDFDPGGRVGVWTQRAKVEYRLLRVGTP